MRKLMLMMVIGLIWGCKAKEDQTQVTVTNPTQNESVQQPPPPIPTEKLLDLYENCDFIDFIFPNLPFSISQEDKASIQQTLRHINNVPPTNYNPSCPYFAQQIFQENGEIVLDAKIFFQPDCTFYLFYEDGKAVYSASFTNEGIQFYNSILAQAEQVRANG